MHLSWLAHSVLTSIWVLAGRCPGHLLFTRARLCPGQFPSCAGHAFQSSETLPVLAGGKLQQRDNTLKSGAIVANTRQADDSAVRSANANRTNDNQNA